MEYLEVDDVLDNLSFEEIFALFPEEKIRNSKLLVEKFLENHYSYPALYPLKILEEVVKKYNLYIPPKCLLHFPNFKELGEPLFECISSEYLINKEDGYIWIIENAKDELTNIVLRNILNFRNKNVITAFIEKGYKLPPYDKITEWLDDEYSPR